ncbi:DUF2185 domain-containing protein [Colwellia psychrerythraea]|uniref:Immunity protein Imm33 domain-containing protein n=1 Tax=Colwellia psychrerythraea TaxID=28229 RepID=A0A099K9P0_COLPS|nr:DUF2185 domain-containing protein [Colwellia psychrerythraea]KGJ86777.1 Protein of unknown function DUF2185 [Colwellia psychrerythraea]
MVKSFKLSSDEITPIAVGYGGCIATDQITVEGNLVGYMYRETPSNEMDNGWRFLSGYETQEYMSEPNNHSVYDLNTIANYDPEIIPFIELPIGTECERDENGVLIVITE